MSLFSWLKRRRTDDDLDDEIRSHLAIAAQDRVTDGEDREAARHAARKDFGNVALITEESHGVWRSRWMNAIGDLWNDARYAIRVLVKSPGFSLVVLLVLALGIGVNTSVFALFKGLALKPLPGVDGSKDLGVIMATTNTGRQLPLSYPDYKYVRDHDRAFAGLAGSSMSRLSMGRGNRAEQVAGELVTGNYFQVLGVRARLGRPLLPSDEIAPGKHPVVVLSDGLWRRSFGADPGVIGKTIYVNGYPLTVVGVADSTFHGTIVSFDIELFIPLMMAPQIGDQNQAPDLLDNREIPVLMVHGRLRPGVSLAAASAQMSVLSAQLAADAPIHGTSRQLTVLPIWQSPYGAQTYMLPAVTVVGVTGALLLLIVCANISGLVLVRGISRRGEIAARLALGANRTRIVRMLLIENLVLAVPGAALGLLPAWYGMPLMMSMSTSAGSAPARIFFDFSVDWLMVGFAVLAALASSLFFGFIPALRSSRMELASVMRDDLSSRGSARGRFRAALVVSQVAVSLLLLVGAGLVARSLSAARQADAGFDARGVISLTLDLKASGYDETKGRAFYQQLLDRVRDGQGTESASLAAFFPMTMVDTPTEKVTVEHYQPRRNDDLSFLNNIVGPDYFRTLQIALVAGREFERRDDPAVQPVAIVNDTLARRFWGSAANALGKRLRVDTGDWRTIIGVARDVKYARINEAPRPYVYLPFLQSYHSNMLLHIRGSAGTAALMDQARKQVQALDPDLPILNAKTLSEQTSASLSIFQMTAGMLLLFGVAAMGLAALGLYGLVAFTVKQSTNEVGVRMALGAGQRDVIWRFLGRGLRLGIIGAAAGLAAAYAATRLLGTLLYGVSATDPASFLAAPAIVLASVLIATLIPAWRAARTDPMSALRHR